MEPESPQDVENEEGGDFVFQSFMEEAEEVVKTIVDVIPANKYDTKIFKKLRKIFQKYQEQPQLLDPHLERIVNPLMEFSRDAISSGDSIFLNNLFKVVYCLTKVRGYKTVVKMFPHEARDLEPVFDALVTQDRADPKTWKTRYVLLLWLSMISLVPFDLITIDSAHPEHSEPLTARMLGVAKSYLADPGISRNASAVFLSKLLTRPDMRQELHAFMHWAEITLRSGPNSFLATGIYTSLTSIFKVGTREDLIPIVPIIFGHLIASFGGGASTGGAQTALQRKLGVKLAQRIGLAYLKPRVAKWRYQRGNRSLLQNLAQHSAPKATHAVGTATAQHQHHVEDVEDEIDVPGEMEDVIEVLLNGLRDRDTVVRWSAAKGVGRTTSRLTAELADDIVASVLSLFTPHEGDGAWHGGCLALAELARRGLLRPERLADVVPVIQQALQYDVQKGSHSVGAHVRDAACYVCWAFARAYSPEVMGAYVGQLATSLIVTAVFDREVNCRRAASAAFQENVGRQGNYPHGIEVLTTADYFTLCNRSNAYLDISVFVAQFDEYRRPLIDHLVEAKLRHWDVAMRELSSKALHNLCVRDPHYFATFVLPSLVPLCVHADLATRHGAILGVAEVTLALCGIDATLVEQAVLKEVCDVPFGVDRSRLYRGRGGEMMRSAVCRLIECVALSGINLIEPPFRYQEMLDENLRHPNEEIIDAAGRAFAAFAQRYYAPCCTQEIQARITLKFVDALDKDDSPPVRRGMALALGVLPKSLAAPHLHMILDVLAKSTRVEEAPEKRDAETRRNAVNSIAQVCETVGVTHDEHGLSVATVPKVFTALLGCMSDYSVDNRGDVGSWVREAAMHSLERVARLLCSADATSKEGGLFLPEHALSLVCAILQQLAEKIDRVRDVAGKVLQRVLLDSASPISHVPHREMLLSAIQDAPQPIDWSSPSVTFPMLMPLLSAPVYRRPILAGLVISIGGLTEHVVRFSSGSLVQHLKKHGQSPTADGMPLVIEVAEVLCDIMRSNGGNDRVIVPMFKMLDALFSAGVFDDITPDQHPFTSDVYDLVKSEIRTSKDISKIMLSVNVFCGIVKFEDPTRTKALTQLLTMLANKFPKVRRLAGEQFYTALLTHEGLLDDELLDEALEILSDTQWDATVADIKQQQLRLFEMFGLTPPSTTSAGTGVAGGKKQDAGYKDLVKEFGF